MIGLFRKIRFGEITIPFAFLAVLVLAFGLLIPSLGIYQDDWLFVYNAYARGPQGLWEFLYADGNPFASIINIALFAIFGFKLLYWHIASLLARWLTVTIFWLVLRRLWPSSPRQTFLAALLFALHPFFTLQPLAYTFLHVWLGYFSLGLSFYWMIRSVQEPRRFWLYTILSLFTEAVTILTLEYFAGLEFLRPVLLWMIVRNREKDFKSSITQTLKLWIPYIAVFGIYVYWRFFIYAVPIKNRNNPVVLETLLSNPLAGMQLIFFNLVPDALLIIVASWFNVLNPVSFDWFDRRNLILTAFSVLSGLLVFFYLSRQTYDQPEESRTNSLWSREAFWLGLVIVVLGLIPPYVGGLFINEKNPLWNSRFGMASMLGASLMIVALVEALFASHKARLIFFAVLLGLTVSYHARYMNDFKNTWKKQANFYRQLVLRVPSLQPNTAIIAEGEILYHMGDYPTAYAINTMLAQPRGDSGEYVNYWFFSITGNFGDRLDEFLHGMDIQSRHRSVRFAGKSDQSLIIEFDPSQGGCLHVIRPQDGVVRLLPSLVKSASRLSALERISPQPTSGLFLREIDLNYPEDWCTYYQQADLARQMGDWSQVKKLWNEAHAKSFAPGVPFEYLPFLEAFAQLGDWDQAVSLTHELKKAPPTVRLALCDFWYSLPATPERDSAFEQVQTELACSAN
jgi:hypothetical protein